MWRSRERVEWRHALTQSLLERGERGPAWFAGWCRKLRSRLDLLAPYVDEGDH